MIQLRERSCNFHQHQRAPIQRIVENCLRLPKGKFRSFVGYKRFKHGVCSLFSSKFNIVKRTYISTFVMRKCTLTGIM